MTDNLGADVLLCTFESAIAGFASFPPRGNFCEESNYSSPPQHCLTNKALQHVGSREK
jgi:hypothetical protein